MSTAYTTDTYTITDEDGDGDVDRDDLTIYANTQGREIAKIFKTPSSKVGDPTYNDVLHPENPLTTHATLTDAEFSALVAGEAVYVSLINNGKETFDRVKVFKAQTVVDSDGDGIPDAEDNCPNVSNPSQADLDNDGTGDACDDDRDGDGIVNSQDCDPDNANITSGDVFYKDADGDGFGNPNKSVTACSQPSNYVTDNTDCNDADSSIHPGATEIAGDGIDQDCNGANLPKADDDNDGIPNDTDNCPNQSNPNQEDSDNDGIGDVCDDTDNNDDDGDGFPNDTDNCPNQSNPNQEDSDNDGIGDVCDNSDDRDDDGDGIINQIDKCPKTPAGTQVGADGCKLLPDEVNLSIVWKAPISCQDGDGYAFKPSEGCEPEAGYIKITSPNDALNNHVIKLLNAQGKEILRSAFANKTILFSIEKNGNYSLENENGEKLNIEINND